MKFLVVNLVFFVFSSSVFANTINLKLHEKIEQAQQYLTSTEKNISNELKLHYIICINEN